VSVRLYWAPIVGDGLTAQTAYRSALQQSGVAVRAIMPTTPLYTADGDVNTNAGKPAVASTIAIASATDWTAVDADASLVLLLPDLGLGSANALLAAIGSKVVSDLPAPYRAKWLAVVTALNVRTDDVSGSTPLRKVLRRVLIALDPQGANDDGFFA
jgi:hypothetical protein